MSKKLHLICNAHLDPVWQWEWEEGAAEALSTFRIAADFCEEYDNFVFCHNEALLYQWIEEYDAELFKKIQRLVKADKWHIMGGWQLQPDCNMPSGESFVRQILSGRKYFLEKFGKVPTVAINFDPFGHTRGLVQIMKKSGYDGYLFMRPDGGCLELPSDAFKWVGYDGSEITAFRFWGGYGSGKGKAAKKIIECIEKCEDDDFFLCLWGVGNHGGGPSREDLENITALTLEKAKEGVEIVQSTPEKFFKDLEENRPLPKFAGSLNSWAPGCYTSMVRVKSKHRKAENEFFLAECMASHAANEGLIEYPAAELAQALYDIMLIEFHDTLPGSSIQPAEEMSMRTLDHALEITSRIKAKAFFALAAGQKKAPSDKIPVFVYNPYPYKVKGDFISEFMLWDQIWDDKFLKPIVYNENGEICPSQCEKEYSSLPLEWRKRVVFNAELEPMKMNRFECGFEETKKPVPELENDETHFIFESESRVIKINKSTGLVDVFSDKKENFVKNGAFTLEVWKDNHDPWYMESFSWLEKIGEFTLLDSKTATEFCCVKNEIDPVRVIESGDTRAVVEALFGYNGSRAVVKYIMSERDGLKIEIRLVWSEKQKLVKLSIPSAFSADTCIGEHAYGREKLFGALKENVSQKYIVECKGDKAILCINNGVYGSSFDDENGELKITLLRSPSYCAHPIGDREVMMQDRYLPYMEQGERDYSFMLDIGETKKILDVAPRAAQHFNAPPMVLSFYPTGTGTLPDSPLKITGNDKINLTAFKKADNGEGYIARLFNPTDKEQSAAVEFYNQTEEIKFTPFEIKTFRLLKERIEETDLMENLID